MEFFRNSAIVLYVKECVYITSWLDSSANYQLDR